VKIESTAIDGPLIITPANHGDHRGFFSETFKTSVLAEQGVHLQWVQDNHSSSAARGVVRGLHFQKAPMAQAKLVRVTRGTIYDVAVDIRKDSPTYGRHVAVELSADNWKQLFVPVGFAHGFCTLEPGTELIYKVTSYYAPEHDFGIAFDDPALGIRWPFPAQALTLSARDLKHPRLAAAPSHFWFEGKRA
jgi:dTDP-4-dehydrorhamnose 3,5-epimerase